MDAVVKVTKSLTALALGILFSGLAITRAEAQLYQVPLEWDPPTGDVNNVPFTSDQQASLRFIVEVQRTSENNDWIVLDSTIAAAHYTTSFPKGAYSFRVAAKLGALVSAYSNVLPVFLGDVVPTPTITPTPGADPTEDPSASPTATPSSAPTKGTIVPTATPVRTRPYITPIPRRTGTPSPKDTPALDPGHATLDKDGDGISNLGKLVSNPSGTSFNVTWYMPAGTPVTEQFSTDEPTHRVLPAPIQVNGVTAITALEVDKANKTVDWTVGDTTISGVGTTTDIFVAGCDLVDNSIIRIRPNGSIAHLTPDSIMKTSRDTVRTSRVLAAKPAPIFGCATLSEPVLLVLKQVAVTTKMKKAIATAMAGDKESQTPAEYKKAYKKAYETIVKKLQTGNYWQLMSYTKEVRSLSSGKNEGYVFLSKKDMPVQVTARLDLNTGKTVALALALNGKVFVSGLDATSTVKARLGKYASATFGVFPTSGGDPSLSIAAENRGVVRIVDLTSGTSLPPVTLQSLLGAKARVSAAAAAATQLLKGPSVYDLKTLLSAASSTPSKN